MRGAAPWPCAPWRPTWDHPRACGEQVKHLNLSQTILGIIPARAGSSSSSPFAFCVVRDHPRACGEQNHRLVRAKGHKGSSPRVRGAVARKRLDRCAGGIIPARAGSRRCVQAITNEWRDHPHACGEQLSLSDFMAMRRGSSPRVRGAAPPLSWENLGKTGIIPARAGSRKRM